MSIPILERDTTLDTAGLPGTPWVTIVWNDPVNLQTASITATGTGVAAGSVAGTYLIAPGTTGVTARDVTVSVVIEFPKNALATTVENTTKLGSVTLSGLNVTLDQQ